MAEFIDELRDYIATLTGLTVGANLFSQMLPDHDGLACAVLDTGGIENPHHDAWRYPTVEVMVETPNNAYAAGVALCYQIHDDLTACSNVVLPTWKMEYLHAIQQPFCHGQNEKGMWWWSFNFRGRAKKR